MKHIIYLILGTLLILFSMNSCTLEKRIYSTGYHVQWHRLKTSSPTKNPPIEKNPVLVHSEAMAALNAPVQIDSLPPIPSIKTQRANIGLDIKKQDILTAFELPLKKLRIDSVQPEFGMVAELEEPQARKTHPLAVWSAVLIGLGVLTLPIYIGFLLIPLSIVFAVISLVQIKKYPLRYKGKKWALYTLYLLAILIASILLTLWISSRLMH